MRVIVPKLRFKEFNNDYTEFKLKDIVNFYKGNTLSKSDIIENGDIKCILYGELYTKYSEIAYKIYSRTNNFSNTLFWGQTNDVLIPCSGETALDISTSTCLQEDNIAIGGDLNILRPLNADGKYLSYLICNKKRKEIAKYAQGDSIVHLYGEKIKNITIYLPTINEQEKISNMLSLLDKKIELQKQKIEALKLYKKGLLQKIMNQKGVKTRLKDILIEYSKKTTINNQYEIISSTKEGLFLQKEYFNRSIASENNIGYKILKINQIVLSPQNLWMGNINYNDKYEIGIVSPSYKIFNINNEFDKYYIFNWLKSEKALYYYTISSEQGASIVRRNLNIEAFEEITFNIPNKKIQNIIGMNIKLIDSKIKLSENKFNYLYNYKKSLLQQMFI